MNFLTFSFKKNLPNVPLCNYVFCIKLIALKLICIKMICHWVLNFMEIGNYIKKKNHSKCICAWACGVVWRGRLFVSWACKQVAFRVKFSFHQAGDWQVKK